MAAAAAERRARAWLTAVFSDERLTRSEIFFQPASGRRLHRWWWWWWCSGTRKFSENALFLRLFSTPRLCRSNDSFRMCDSAEGLSSLCRGEDSFSAGWRGPVRGVGSAFCTSRDGILERWFMRANARRSTSEACRNFSSLVFLCLNRRFSEFQGACVRKLLIFNRDEIFTLSANDVKSIQIVYKLPNYLCFPIFYVIELIRSVLKSFKITFDFL